MRSAANVLVRSCDTVLGTHKVQRFTERASDWLLRHAGQPDAMAAAVVRLRPSVRQLARSFVIFGCVVGG